MNVIKHGSPYSVLFGTSLGILTLGFRESFQNYWVFGLWPSSRILNARKYNVSENGCVSVLRWREGDISMGVFPSSGEGKETSQWVCFRPQVKGRRHLICWTPNLELQTMDEIQKPSNSQCYAPLWEAFKFYSSRSLLQLNPPKTRRIHIHPEGQFCYNRTRAYVPYIPSSLRRPSLSKQGDRILTLRAGRDVS
jgi:hypothetical protein